MSPTTALLLLMAARGDGNMLVTPEWLSKHLHDPGIVILHVGAPADYAAGHIPGARLVTLDDISVTGDRGLRLELPPDEQLRGALEKLGISDAVKRIVVYAATDSVQSATRVWFTLDYAGLGERAALLDGGLAVWRSGGRAVAAEPAAPSASSAHLTIRPRREVVADPAWIAQHKQSITLIDARLPQYYSGAEMGYVAKRTGHIPGARNVPYTSLVDEQRRLLAANALKKRLAGAGPVVAYCHIGQQATVVYFAARLLGIPVRLYDGSFQDWSMRSELPVAGSPAGPQH
jgi:thiosulfate/3-mercaptopyruvate sulfurtransferase